MALLIRIAAALRESPGCAGAVVVGSFAKDSADRLSDIDLVVFCPEGAGHSLLQTIIKQFAPSKILFTFDGMHDLDRVIDRLANVDNPARRVERPKGPGPDGRPVLLRLRRSIAANFRSRPTSDVRSDVVPVAVSTWTSGGQTLCSTIGGRYVLLL
ncbi:nucleotidyltransferase domain-containing protein [Paraburkholderia sp. Cpub6]|uniref:nucleotidyltransferase domain-containing protein n=1 Tax=Paraburkholderia sp. Cpub6 TaxID=2723094 RepID=UPI00161B848E